MESRYLLYKNTNIKKDKLFFEKFSLIEFRPKLFKLYHPLENKSRNTTLGRLMFLFNSFGKFKLYLVIDNEKGKLCHVSYRLPKMSKFKFMKKGDYEIGPCYTSEAYRGRGIYPNVLRAICDCGNGVGGESYYMIVHETNKASIRGVEKAGFTKVGFVKRTRILRRYKLVERFGTE